PCSTKRKRKMAILRKKSRYASRNVLGEEVTHRSRHDDILFPVPQAHRNTNLLQIESPRAREKKTVPGRALNSRSQALARTIGQQSAQFWIGKRLLVSLGQTCLNLLRNNLIARAPQCSQTNPRNVLCQPGDCSCKGQQASIQRYHAFHGFRRIRWSHAAH